MTTRELVYYGDIDFATPDDEQYRDNMLRQLNDPTVDPDTSIEVLEDLVDNMQDSASEVVPDRLSYLPMVTDDYRIAFCQVTKVLPELCQVEIWKQLLVDCEPIMPKTPEKKCERITISRTSSVARRLF